MGLETLTNEIKTNLVQWLKNPETIEMFETEIVDKFTRRLTHKMYPFVLYMFLIFIATLGSIVVAVWFIIRTWSKRHEDSKKKGEDDED